MPVNRKLLKQIALGTGTIGGISGAGYLGHRIGFKRGATRMSDIMGNEFEEFNTEENKAIAKRFYKQGINDTISTIQNKMFKQANLNQMVQLSFKNELEKLSAASPAFRVAKETGINIGKRIISKFKPSYIKGSYKNLGQSIKDLKTVHQMESKKAGTGKEHINKFIEGIKKSKMALGVTGAGIVGTGYTGHKILENKNQPYYTYTM